MLVRAILGAAACAAQAGCTHRQLARSTVRATGTVMDIQYHTVLTNLALMSRHPEALPSHIDLADGIASVRLTGVCAGCPATIMTVITSLEEELRKKVPEVEILEAVP